MPTEARAREFLDLLAPIHDQARRVARRMARSDADGDDLFQEAALRALTKLPSLRDRARFRSWFFQILLSLHRSRARRSFWRRLVPVDDAPEQALVEERDESAEERRLAAERARRALAILPAVQREAVVLFEIEGYSVEEIAELQAVSPSAVKSRLSRGRTRLRRHYERNGLGSRESRDTEDLTHEYSQASI